MKFASGVTPRELFQRKILAEFHILSCFGLAMIVGSNRSYFSINVTQKWHFSLKVHFFCIFLPKYLHMSKIFCTFAVDLEKEIKPTSKWSRAWGKTLKLPNWSEAQ